MFDAAAARAATRPPPACRRRRLPVTTASTPGLRPGVRAIRNPFAVTVPASDMDIAAKRVFDAAAGRARLAVATGHGLAVVGISGDAVGEFGLALHEPARSVAAAGDGRVLAATASGVALVALSSDAGVAGTRWTATISDRPASAVAIVEAPGPMVDANADADRAVVAAGEDGVVRRADLADVGAAPDETPPSSPQPGNWRSIGEATVRSADGRLLAAADGVFRVGTDGIDHVGLDDARDVAAAGPYAATRAGCYRLGPGWTAEVEEPTDLVSARPGAPAGRGAGDEGEPDANPGPGAEVPDPDDTAVEDAAPTAAAAPTAGAAPIAHAARGETFLARTADGWRAVPWPSSAPVAGVAYGRPDGPGAAIQAVAADGTVAVDDGDGWRTRSIGLPDVRDCAVVV